jgi:hypothetical protein
MPEQQREEYVTEEDYIGLLKAIRDIARSDLGCNNVIELKGLLRTIELACDGVLNHRRTEVPTAFYEAFEKSHE